MYKLVITSGKGPSRKVETKEYWMTQDGLHQAESEFEKLQQRPDVTKLMLWRVDVKGVHDIKGWVRDNAGGIKHVRKFKDKGYG